MYERPEKIIIGNVIPRNKTVIIAVLVISVFMMLIMFSKVIILSIPKLLPHNINSN